MIARLFNKCLNQKKIPQAWKSAIMIILHKKGDMRDLRNCRPISLIYFMHKVFSHVLKRMSNTLNQQQPKEEAGFRSSFSTVDHLQTITQLQEKAREYKVAVCLAFVDYEKAFDSIEHQPFFSALTSNGIHCGLVYPRRFKSY